MESNKIKELIIMLPVLMSLGTLFLVLWLLKGPAILPLAKYIFRGVAFSVLLILLWIKYWEKQRIRSPYLTLAFLIFVFSMSL